MTARLPFTQVDAFADRPFGGNPAAVVPLDAWLPDDVLQRIAEENNLSETAFTVPTDGDADYELRWFTPTTEVALCGHATLASGHVLIGAREAVRFRTRRSGVLTVGRGRDGGYTLDLPATPTAPREDPALLAALGVDGQSFRSTGGAEDVAVILVADEAAVRACAPDMARLRDIPVMAIVTAPGDDADMASRVFVPAWGVDEDPVTGSAHAALAPFWAQRLARLDMTAVQASRREGRMRCEVRGDRVVLTGGCVTVIEGQMRL
ncbi:PhzF family phenazine biosynthesis protein [Sphingomonas jejuensis]|uniref:PhzF family phenazine biosynthesis protein n=1 Tax=Sphingomonas jejuensis TaxID=904715 RepID=A0ABX0XPF7_9SPHN|nr:PhzF family phenazine biosynthesis protein [Sphingomonas jejuensis]